MGEAIPKHCVSQPSTDSWNYVRNLSKCFWIISSTTSVNHSSCAARSTQHSRQTELAVREGLQCMSFLACLIKLQLPTHMLKKEFPLSPYPIKHSKRYILRTCFYWESVEVRKIGLVPGKFKPTKIPTTIGCCRFCKGKESIAQDQWFQDAELHYISKLNL